MGGEFIPQLQEGDFAFHCIFHREVHCQSIETSMQASRIIKQFDEVKMVSEKQDLQKFLQIRCRRKLQI
jgi:cobalt-zinc-cadmium resistance protein CzcA